MQWGFYAKVPLEKGHMTTVKIEAPSVRVSDEHFCRCEGGSERTAEHPPRLTAAGRLAACLLLALLAASCSGLTSSLGPPPFPLVLVSDVGLPGAAARFDYQDIDVTHGHLVMSHMGDDSVVVVQVSGGSVVKVLPGIPVPRGVVVADSVGRIFVTSTGTLNQLVIIDSTSLTEIARVATGNSPDGVGGLGLRSSDRRRFRSGRWGHFAYRWLGQWSTHPGPAGYHGWECCL